MSVAARCSEPTATVRGGRCALCFRSSIAATILPHTVGFRLRRRIFARPNAPPLSVGPPDLLGGIILTCGSPCAAELNSTASMPGHGTGYVAISPVWKAGVPKDLTSVAIEEDDRSKFLSGRGLSRNALSSQGQTSLTF